MMENFFRTYDRFITFNDLRFIDSAKPSSEQEENNFKEDLLQMECKEGFIVDVGWYCKEIDILSDGWFMVLLIKNFNWENPLVEKKATNMIELESILCELASDYCKN